MLELKSTLDRLVALYNKPAFIIDDPISIPHRFTKKQDIEIISFWVSMLAWGNRKSIINSGDKLCALLDNDPHNFICQHNEKERARFENFVHRTFQYTDSLYFLSFLQWYYQNHPSLEDFFHPYVSHPDGFEAALIDFHNLFFSLPFAPKRTRKHIATPARKSSCKRLNMFLRWMVRSDNAGVDFGLWSAIPTKLLYIPLDVHVEKSARNFGLLQRKIRDWQAVKELTQNLRRLDPEDPVKYDFALFAASAFGSL